MYDTYMANKAFDDVHKSIYENMKKIKEPTQAFEKIKKPEYSFKSLYDEFMILITIFQISGFFPIGRHGGKINTNAYSPMAIHSYLVFIAMTSVTCSTLLDLIHSITTFPMRFDDKILHAAIISFMMITFAPIITFFERKKIAKYFESWDFFQAEFEGTTGKPLVIKARKKLKIVLVYLCCSLPVYMYFLYMAAETRFAKFKLEKSWHRYGLIICYAYYGFVSHAISFLWYFHNNALCQAATSILNYFEECKNKGKCSSEMGALWLRLQDLLCDLGKAHSYLILFFFFYLFVVVMLIGYSALANFGSDRSLLIGGFRFGLFFIGFLSLSIVPGFADMASKKVVEDILNFVLRWAAQEKNLVVARDLKWMAESVSIKKPAISLGGYVVLSKSVNVSMYGAMLTYFVVVLQFKTTNESQH